MLIATVNAMLNTIVSTSATAILVAMLSRRMRHFRSDHRDAGSKHIAAAAHGLDEFGTIRIDAELAPQPADLHIHAAIETVGGPAAGEIEQLVAVEHPLR